MVLSPDAFEEWKAALRVQWEASIVAFRPEPAAPRIDPDVPVGAHLEALDVPPCAGHNVDRAPIVVGGGGGGREIGYARGGNGGSGSGSTHGVSGGAGGCGNTQARARIEIHAVISEQEWAAFRMGMEDLRLYRERFEAFRERMAREHGGPR